MSTGLFNAIIRLMSKTYCIFSANYLPNTGGVEKYTQNLSKALVKAGNYVVIVTMNVFGLAQHESLEEGIEIIRLPCYKMLKGRFPVPKHNQLYQAEMRRLEERDIDFIVVNTRFYLHSFTGMKLSAKKGIIPIVIDHGSAHLTMGNRVIDVFVSACEHILTSVIKRYPAHYYGVSNASVQWLYHFGIKARGVLANAINAEEFRNSSSHRDFKDELKLCKDTFIVVYVGRFIPEKGMRTLVECAKILIDCPSIQFILAGEGPMKEYLKRQSLSNMHVVGALDSSDVAALFSIADANCLLSRSEGGFPTTILEAAVCKTISITTNVGSVIELMPTSDYGVVLETSNSKEAADAIRYLQKNPSINRLIGENIKSRVESEFSWSKTAKKVENVCIRANRQ